MNTVKLARPWLRVCASVLAGSGLVVSTFGLTSGTAEAARPPAPTYHHHWCPGDDWNPGWGNNWDWGQCHDWDDGFGPAGWEAPPRWVPPPPPWAQPPWRPW
jgi:hypothetical protein